MFQGWLITIAILALARNIHVVEAAGPPLTEAAGTDGAVAVADEKTPVITSFTACVRLFGGTATSSCVMDCQTKSSNNPWSTYVEARLQQDTPQPEGHRSHGEKSRFV